MCIYNHTLVKQDGKRRQKNGSRGSWPSIVEYLAQKNHQQRTVSTSWKRRKDYWELSFDVFRSKHCVMCALVPTHMHAGKHVHTHTYIHVHREQTRFPSRVVGVKLLCPYSVCIDKNKYTKQKQSNIFMVWKKRNEAERREKQAIFKRELDHPSAYVYCQFLRSGDMETSLMVMNIWQKIHFEVQKYGRETLLTIPMPYQRFSV